MRGRVPILRSMPAYSAPDAQNSRNFHNPLAKAMLSCYRSLWGADRLQTCRNFERITEVRRRGARGIRSSLRRFTQVDLNQEENHV